MVDYLGVAVKYKPGDMVLIRQWDDMVREFGLNETGRIIRCSFGFVMPMKERCGELLIIDGYGNGGYRMSNIGYTWCDDMIECKVSSIPKENLRENVVSILRDGRVVLNLSGRYYNEKLIHCDDRESDVIRQYVVHGDTIEEMLDIEKNGILIWVA